MLHNVLITNPILYKQKLLNYAKKFQQIAWLDSHSEIKNYSLQSDINGLVALGAKESVRNEMGKSSFSALKKFVDRSKWAFGFLTYDLKNETEVNLNSNNPDELAFPEMYFFEPEALLLFTDDAVQIQTENFALLKELIELDRQEFKAEQLFFKVEPKARISAEQYIQKVKQIQQKINRGDVYELNFCHEFYADNCAINPFDLFVKLSEHSPSPFASFFRLNDQYILCASPERFLKKKGQTLISQPIKGTVKRGLTAEEDEKLKYELRNNPKEQSENVMIVDLVRNDMSHIAKDGSVNVKELFGIYTFPQVHQMISTIECEIKANLHPVDVIKNCFPMGSMTGAPKVRAMQLIDEFEESKRGVYSGSIGYFSPVGNFDFNVVIRSILYHAQKQKLSFSVGSAITHHSIPEQEYQETLVKAKAIFEVLS